MFVDLTFEAQEDGVHQVFSDHGFYYPIKVTVGTEKPLEGFPWIKPSDFIKALDATNDMSHLLGGHSLKEARPILDVFWQRFKGVYPEHQLWDYLSATGRDARQCLPIFIHGDEGTSFKRSGILMVSIQGVIGHGTSKSTRLIEANLRAMGEGIGLNFLKSGLQTRLLVCACPKEGVLYK